MAKRTNLKDKPLSEEQKRIAELERQLALATGSTSSSNASDVIGSTEYVKIMSLVPFPLILSTRERGQGKVFRFSFFGEVKNILYQDFLEVCEVHRRFLESGYFYVMDKRVVRNQGLEDVYSKILTKEKIEGIFSNSPESIEFYRTCNASQQSVIIEMITDKLFKEPDSIDLYVVDRLSRESGVDIRKRVDDLTVSLAKPV